MSAHDRGLKVTDKEAKIDQRWQSAAAAFRAGDKAGALYRFKSLVRDGELSAYREIGNIYELGGNGIEQDFDKAFHWYKRAINEADDVWGYIGLGRLYYYGKGVPCDYKKAFWYYSMAESNEKPIVYLILGRMYHLGQGVKVDLQKARAYYQKAAKQDYIFAIKNLGIVERDSGHYLKAIALRIKAVLVALKILLTKGTGDKRLSSG